MTLVASEVAIVSTFIRLRMTDSSAFEYCLMPWIEILILPSSFSSLACALILSGIRVCTFWSKLRFIISNLGAAGPLDVGGVVGGPFGVMVACVGASDVDANGGAVGGAFGVAVACAVAAVCDVDASCVGN